MIIDRYDPILRCRKPPRFVQRHSSLLIAPDAPRLPLVLQLKTPRHGAHATGPAPGFSRRKRAHYGADVSLCRLRRHGAIPRASLAQHITIPTMIAFAFEPRRTPPLRAVRVH